MGMSIVKYSEKNSHVEFWGVLREGSIHQLKSDYPTHREVMARYFSERDVFESDIDRQAVDAKDVLFNSPVSTDVQLFCQGLNYADHRAESGAADAKEENLIFMKAASSICGPNDTIVKPAGCQLLDYEIELALVLKEAVRKPVAISESDLARYVGGLILCNDVSARDIMFGSPMLQWFRGEKSAHVLSHGSRAVPDGPSRISPGSTPSN